MRRKTSSGSFQAIGIATLGIRCRVIVDCRLLLPSWRPTLNRKALHVDASRRQKRPIKRVEEPDLVEAGGSDVNRVFRSCRCVPNHVTCQLRDESSDRVLNDEGLTEEIAHQWSLRRV